MQTIVNGANTSPPIAERLPYAGLLLANGILLAALLLGSLTICELLIVFWLELAIIGAYALLCLGVAALFGRPFESRHVGVTRGTTALLALLAAIVFMAKFGSVLLGLGVLLIFLPLDEGMDGLRQAGSGIWIPMSVSFLLLSHLLTFVFFFLREKGYLETNVITLLLSPYARGLSIFVAIGAGSMLASSAGAEPVRAFTLGVLVVKIAFDILSLAWHRRLVRKTA